MGFLSKIFSSGVGSLIKEVGGVVDKFHLSGEEKQEFQLKMKELVQKRDSEIEQTIRADLQAKERILVAELTQGDNYTKRARPTVVYFGLFVIFFNYCVAPVVSAIVADITIPALNLPTAFWTAWGGICATWSIGRSVEKIGATNKLSKFITGSKEIKSSLLD